MALDDKELMAMLAFVRGQTKDLNQQAEMLAMLTDEEIPEEFNPMGQLPVQNEIPAYSLNQKGVGGDLAGLDYGVPAPMFGEKAEAGDIGSLLVGEQ